MTKAKQKRVNEYNWSRVPTYKGGRRSKRLATSKGGAKHEPPEEDINMYDCFSDDDKEDKEMEPEPSERPNGLTCPLLQKLARDIRNEEKQARNENRRRARAERHTRRKKKQVIKEVEKVIQETKAALKHNKAAAIISLRVIPIRDPGEKIAFEVGEVGYR